jgi:hypothetical protein
VYCGKYIESRIIHLSNYHYADGARKQRTRLDITLAPGETAELIAVFDPMAHGPDAVGPIKRDVILTTDSTETPEIRFSFLGNVVR